jgi:hypothetical protein
VVVVAFLVGIVLATVLWALSGPAFTAPVFTRENFRGVSLPTAAGVILVLVALVGAAALAVAVALGAEPPDGTDTGLRLVALASAGFGLLGLLDDLGGVGESGGFTGHLKALARGRLTTGGTKLFVGAAVAVVVVSAVEPDSIGRLLADGALVALAANLGNLFDRAPGRTTKVSLLAFAALVVAAGAEDVLTGVALVVGASVGLLAPDLGERLMLGDAGANVVGAALGLGVVLACSPGTRTGVLVALVVLNLASEKVSFSKVIARTPPLRWFDHLGRRP